MNKHIPLAAAILVCVVGAAHAQLPTNGLRLWVKADAGVQTSDGLVTNWIDQSSTLGVIGNNWNLKQPNLAMAPDFVSNWKNGLPAIHFNGLSATNFLHDQHDFFGSFPSGASVFIVAQNDSRKDINGLFKLYTGLNPLVGGLTHMDIYYQTYNSTGSSSGTATYFARRALWSAQGGYAVGTNQPPPLGNAYIYDVSATANTVAQRVNGANAISYTGGGSTLTNFLPGVHSTYPAVGAYGSGYPNVGTLNGYIAEIIVYQTQLSPADHASVYEYLLAKYAIPEPATGMLLALSGLLVLLRRR